MAGKYTFQYINRRMHLYLGMFCLPWFIMYGISSLAFNHNNLFNNGSGQPGGEWAEVQSWPFKVDIPESGEIPEEATRELIRAAGLEAKAFGAYRAGENKINIYLPNFRKMTQLNYWTTEERLVLLERKKFTQQFIGGLHARGGYQHDSFLDDTWAFVVDVVCIAFLISALPVIRGNYKVHHCKQERNGHRLFP
jgi:hypothetical protein